MSELNVCDLKRQYGNNCLTMENCELEYFDAAHVCISMKQGNAAAAHPLVAVGDEVRRGQLIGSNGAESYIYASISGIVKEIRQVRASVHEMVDHVVIEKAGNDDGMWMEFEDKADDHTLLKRIGVMSWMPADVQDIDRKQAICLAAFDRQPLVYSEYRLLMESPAKIIFGARVLAGIYRLSGLKIYVCAEEVRYVLEKAVHTYRKNIAPIETVQFVHVPDDIYVKNSAALDGKCFSPMALCAVYDGFYDDKPLMMRAVTVGGALKYPKNLWVPNGTPVRALLEYCGGLKAGTANIKSYVNHEMIETLGFRVVEGGPLRGHNVCVDDTCVSMTTSSILVLPERMAQSHDCTLCGRCADVCGAGINPMAIERALDQQMNSRYKAMASQCVQCGLCAYACPAMRPLKEKVLAAGKMHGASVRQKSEVSAGSLCAAADYIELEASLADGLETLTPQSDSGPYMHCGCTVTQLAGRFSALLGVMLILYSYFYGSVVLLAALAAAAVYVLLEQCYGYFKFRTAFWPVAPMTWYRGIYAGILAALILAGETMQSGAGMFMRWQLSAVLLIWAASKLSVWHSVLTGVTAVLALDFALDIPDALAISLKNTVNASLILTLGWLAVWMYLVWKKYTAPWATLIYLSCLAVFELVAFGMGYSVFRGQTVVILAAVVFVNDYCYGGRDSKRLRILAALSALLAGIGSLFLPAGPAVCLGLFLANIIACNLNAYTI